MVAADPDWRMGPLHRLGLHRCPMELPEAAVEDDLRLRPAGDHQRQPLVETGHERPRVNPEAGELTAASSRPEPDLHPPVAQTIERADALGQVDRTVEGADKD